MRDGCRCIYPYSNEREDTVTSLSQSFLKNEYRGFRTFKRDNDCNVKQYEELMTLRKEVLNLFTLRQFAQLSNYGEPDPSAQFRRTLSSNAKSLRSDRASG